jgi:hypothetical protein
MRKDTQEVDAWEEVAKEQQKRTTAVEDVQDAANARKEGDKEQDAAGGGVQEGVAVRGKIQCGGGSRPALQWIAAEGDKE